MSTAERIRRELERALAPEILEVHDDSHMHAGHAGARPGGETQFRVRVVAAAFRGISRAERHRRVYGLPADALAGQLHALPVPTETPEGAPQAIAGRDRAN